MNTPVIHAPNPSSRKCYEGDPPGMPRASSGLGLGSPVRRLPSECVVIWWCLTMRTRVGGVAEKFEGAMLNHVSVVIVSLSGVSSPTCAGSTKCQAAQAEGEEQLRRSGEAGVL